MPRIVRFSRRFLSVSKIQQTTHKFIRKIWHEIFQNTASISRGILSSWMNSCGFPRVFLRELSPTNRIIFFEYYHPKTILPFCNTCITSPLLCTIYKHRKEPFSCIGKAVIARRLVTLLLESPNRPPLSLMWRCYQNGLVWRGVNMKVPPFSNNV